VHSTISKLYSWPDQALKQNKTQKANAVKAGKASQQMFLMQVHLQLMIITFNHINS